MRARSDRGISVRVLAKRRILLKVCAKCIDGQDQIAKRRIEDVLYDPDQPDDVMTEDQST
jgi:hypothetical protein